MTDFAMGTILVPTDAEPANAHGATLLDAMTGATTVQAIALAGALSQSEGGAALPGAVFCVAGKDGTPPHVYTKTVLTWSPVPLTQLSTNGSLFPTQDWWIESPIASDFGTTFYVSRVFDPFVSQSTPFNAQIKSLSATGTVGGTTWTLDDETNGVTLRSMSPTGDNQTLIFSVADFGRGGVGGQPIALWNLLTNTRGATIVTPDINWAWLEDLFVIPGTTDFLVSGYDLVTKACQVRRYTITGTLVKAFAVPALTSVTLTRMGLDLDAPSTYFWTRSFQQDSPTLTTFQMIRIATGDVVLSWQIPSSETNAAEPTVSCPILARSPVPAPPSGFPLTPPFFSVDAEGVITPAGGLVNVPIRRVRRSPHFSTEQVRNFFEFFQLDVQPGVGTTVGPGQNPVVFLSWSNDGGYTWSNELELAVGREGAYLTRVYAMMLGSARDRVWQVASSDPVFTVWLNAFLRYTPGLS
jgi:hypothetical protein